MNLYTTNEGQRTNEGPRSKQTSQHGTTSGETCN
jgi:hypothetical protein